MGGETKRGRVAGLSLGGALGVVPSLVAYTVTPSADYPAFAAMILLWYSALPAIVAGVVTSRFGARLPGRSGLLKSIGAGLAAAAAIVVLVEFPCALAM
jgi:hypothetical protein